MRRVTPIKIEFKYEEVPDGKGALRIMYGRIFEAAKRNLIEKRKNQETEDDFDINRHNKYLLTYQSSQ